MTRSPASCQCTRSQVPSSKPTTPSASRQCIRNRAPAKRNSADVSVTAFLCTKYSMRLPSNYSLKLGDETSSKRHCRTRGFIAICTSAKGRVEILGFQTSWKLVLRNLHVNMPSRKIRSSGCNFDVPIISFCLLRKTNRGQRKKNVSARISTVVIRDNKKGVLEY